LAKSPNFKTRQGSGWAHIDLMASILLPKKKRKKKGKKKKNKKTTHPHFELFFPNRRYTEYVDCSTGKKKTKKHCDHKASKNKSLENRIRKNEFIRVYPKHERCRSKLPETQLLTTAHYKSSRTTGAQEGTCIDYGSTGWVVFFPPNTACTKT